MLGHESYFFHNTIRKYIVIMGNLMGGFVVSRKGEDDKQRFQRVPISFTGKERFLLKLNSPESLDPTDKSDPTRKARVATIAPAMALELVDMTYIADKKTNAGNRALRYGDTSDVNPSYMLRNPVPYRFTFNLSIFTRNLNDQFELLEQILPFFQPSFTCKIKELKEGKVVIDDRDIMINLDDVQFQNDMVGAVEAKRYLQADLAFSLDGWLYPPISEVKEIHTVFIDFYANEVEVDPEGNLEGVDWIGHPISQESTKRMIDGIKIGDEGRNYE